MTTNQISYMKAKIEEAHYDRSDAENARHNYAVEQLTKEQNEETRRANLARETELHRANVASESNYYQNLMENARHNTVTEAQNAQQLDVSRANLALQQTRTEAQNALDYAGVQLRGAQTEQTLAETTLTGYKTEGQKVSNAQNTLAYNLDVTYKEFERASSEAANANFSFSGLPKLIVGASKLAFASSQQSKIPSTSYITKEKKPYFQLNTR